MFLICVRSIVGEYALQALAELQHVRRLLSLRSLTILASLWSAEAVVQTFGVNRAGLIAFASICQPHRRYVWENPASRHWSPLTGILNTSKSADCSFLYSFPQILWLGLTFLTFREHSTA
jgi:hypothetical protein